MSVLLPMLECAQWWIDLFRNTHSASVFCARSTGCTDGRSYREMWGDGVCEDLCRAWVHGPSGSATRDPEFSPQFWKHNRVIFSQPGTSKAGSSCWTAFQMRCCDFPSVKLRAVMGGVSIQKMSVNQVVFRNHCVEKGLGGAWGVKPLLSSERAKTQIFSTDWITRCDFL